MHSLAGGFQTLATNGLKQRIFSSDLLYVSQELFYNTYRKVISIDIFKNLRNFVSKCLFQGFIEQGYYKIGQ